MEKKRVIVWFRNDLRLHDNEALIEAMDAGDEIYPVYVFDTRVFMGETSYGFRKTGIYRARFIIESVSCLRDNLKAKGLDLIIRTGLPEEEIFELARDLKTSWVFCNRERTAEEIAVQDALEKNLWSVGQELRFSRGKMLFYTADLPFPVTQTPDTFTSFRKEVEKMVPVRSPIPVPDEIPFGTQTVENGVLPDLQDFGFDDEEIEQSSQALVPGGEDAGLNRLQEYFWETDLVRTYKKTRNGLLGMDYSSKYSAYLSQGCLSPKFIYKELKLYEEERVENSSTYHLFYELMWRDFFRLMGKKYEEAIFLRGGIKNEPRKELKDDMTLFRIWADGRTGIPFIDAAMREINTTGYMSNRARQNTSSFLINDLGVNWQIGAEYFESLLIDYDPCSNWGNWMYVAGVGNDPRSNRYFNVLSQAERYDPNGEFVRYWIPELKEVPDEFVHQPHQMTEEEQHQFGVILGKDYPDICVRPAYA